MIPSDPFNPEVCAGVEALVDRMVARFHADLEAMCETAIQGGEHGVLVTWEGMTYTIEVSPDVPYGVIHERRG